MLKEVQIKKANFDGEKVLNQNLNQDNNKKILDIILSRKKKDSGPESDFKSVVTASTQILYEE